MLTACAPSAGPDKQFMGMLKGGAVGAGSGAVTGAKLSAGTGPGVMVGAGIGALAGGIEGFIQDQTEDQLLELDARTRYEQQVAFAQEILADQYRRRVDLHPTRELYPADLFFVGDNVQVSAQGRFLIRELAKLNYQRLPWSRLAVISYVRANEKKVAQDEIGVSNAADGFSEYLAGRRAREFSDLLVSAGIEPRRIEARGVIIDAPILIDPLDDPARYNQVIELLPLDR